MQIVNGSGVGGIKFGVMPRRARLDTTGTPHVVIGRTIERGRGTGSEAVCGACAEDILRGGGEEIGIYWSLDCEVFGGDHIVGQSVWQFRARGQSGPISISCI